MKRETAPLQHEPPPFGKAKEPGDQVISGSSRVTYLDGLRGLACLQVLVLHLLSCYFPNFVENKDPNSLGQKVFHSPALLLYNGWLAVFLFFLLSGYVLTRSFSSAKGEISALVEARVARLWIPAAVFGVFSSAMYFLFGDAHRVLGGLNDAGLLKCCWNIDFHLAPVLRDLVVTPVFVGYQNSLLATMFPETARFFVSSGAALNSPAWSLSVEMLGSLLVLLLVLLRRRRAFFWFLCVVLSSMASPMLGCFAVGHVAAVYRLGEDEPLLRGPSAEAVKAALFGAGWYLTYSIGDPTRLFLGASLMFIAVLQSGPARRILDAPLCRELGRRSFTIYLIHWAFVLGFGSWVIVSLTPVVDWQTSRFFVAPIIFFVVVALSGPLTKLDDVAVRISRAARTGRWDFGILDAITMKSVVAEKTP